VWADTAHRSKRNEKHIARTGLFSKVHFKKPQGIVEFPAEQQTAIRTDG